MLNIKVQSSSSVEETFVFGSPPLLNGFAYNTCRRQEGLLKAKQQQQHQHQQQQHQHQQQHQQQQHDCFNNYTSNCSHCYDLTTPTEVANKDTSPVVAAVAAVADSMNRKEFQTHHNNKFPQGGGGYGSGGYGRSYSNFQNARNAAGAGGGGGQCRTIESVAENLNQLNMNGMSRGSHVDNGIKILEQAGFKVQQIQKQQREAAATSPPAAETVFKKRKDLRVLKSALSKERFREVAVKFGDGDEGGKEISESVQRSMRNANSTQISCLYCKTECQIYENFPIVDGTLFLTPVVRSPDCVKFIETAPSPPAANNTAGGQGGRYMGFVCVNCMEGRPKALHCSGCDTRWKGSLYQVGTMYSYDILSATPCCEKHVTCNSCEKPIIDLSKGEAATLFFSNFSTKSKCPHCEVDDFHFVKPLTMFTLKDS